jgi:hypothetical protein
MAPLPSGDMSNFIAEEACSFTELLAVIMPTPEAAMEPMDFFIAAEMPVADFMRCPFRTILQHMKIQ